MKNLFGLLCCLSASTAFADLKSQCLNLITTIHNETLSACQLVQQDIYNARILSSEGYAFILPRETKTIKIQEQESVLRDYSELSLSYVCGSGQVTVRISKEPCIRGGALFANTVAISNMEAVAKVSVGSVWYNRPGTVAWTFSEN